MCICGRNLIISEMFNSHSLCHVRSLILLVRAVTPLYTLLHGSRWIRGEKDSCTPWWSTYLTLSKTGLVFILVSLNIHVSLGPDGFTSGPVVTSPCWIPLNIERDIGGCYILLTTDPILSDILCKSEPSAGWLSRAEESLGQETTLQHVLDQHVDDAGIFYLFCLATYEEEESQTHKVQHVYPAAASR